MNQLEGKTGRTVELLEALTDEQLAEQVEYFREKHSATAGYNRWRWGRQLALADAELEKRAHA
jgi:hypothetical protein